MLKKIKSRIKSAILNYLGIPEMRQYISENSQGVAALGRAHKSHVGMLRDATTVSADISANTRTGSQIIVTGKFKRNDYVRIFDVDDREFESVVDHLANYAKYHKVGRLDVPYGARSFVVDRLRMEGVTDEY